MCIRDSLYSPHDLRHRCRLHLHEVRLYGAQLLHGVCVRIFEPRYDRRVRRHPLREGVRVNEITGHNDHWGDYTLKIQYVNDKLENMNRYDKNGYRKGGLSVTKEQGVITYAVNDYVYNVDADSIARLDLWLKGKYGAGNYSLEDN